VLLYSVNGKCDDGLICSNGLGHQPDMALQYDEPSSHMIPTSHMAPASQMPAAALEAGDVPEMMSPEQVSLADDVITDQNHQLVVSDDGVKPGQETHVVTGSGGDGGDSGLELEQPSVIENIHVVEHMQDEGTSEHERQTDVEEVEQHVEGVCFSV